MMRSKPLSPLSPAARSPSAPRPNLVVAPTKSSLADRVVKDIAVLAERAIGARGVFTLGLSGGSLPALLKGLPQHLGHGTDWDCWQIFFTDERCVALDSEDSNYRACLDAFLSRCPIPKSNIHTIAPSLIGTPSKAAADYSKQLAAIFGDDCDFPEFDLVLLGVGPDGHTASLFPGHELVSERNAWVASLDDSPKAPPSRITLTLPVLNSSRSVFFVAAGESKACILQGLFTTVHGTSLAIDPEVEGVIYPCGLVTGSQRLTWYVDDDAASRLHPDVMEAALPPGLGQF